MQPHVLPLMQRLSGDIFQQDCSDSHGKGVRRLSPHCYTLPRPAGSPYLSHIEHIWDHLGRRVGLPTSLNELEQCFSNCGTPPGWAQ
ncbi:transposable element Tcb1 transposase [Trichonephila clavipes]|nr:transposable element Tcb1 transposase [Trichonephila clavipes]